MVCLLGHSFYFLGRNNVFSGFWSLDERRLGISYLWHADGAWAPSDHDVDPLCSHRKSGGNPQLSLLAVFSTIVLYWGNPFSTRLYFLMCHGSYLEVIVFTQVRTNPFINRQINSDIKVMYFQKIVKRATVCLLHSR